MGARWKAPGVLKLGTITSWGFLSAAGTRGSARGSIFAPNGFRSAITSSKLLHRAGQGLGYLNYEQSPVASLPRPSIHVSPRRRVRSANPRTLKPYQPQPIPTTETADGPGARADPHADAGDRLATPRRTQGAKGSRPALQCGSPGKTAVGSSRVAESGFTPQEKKRLVTSRPTSTAGSNGMVTIPDDVGGLHELSVRQGQRPRRAKFHFVVETSIVDISPPIRTCGGTPVTIHLKRRRLDRVRQHLCGDVRQTPIWATPADSTVTAIVVNQLHRHRRTGRAT